MPIGFQVQRLNHSAITPLASRRDRTIGLTLTKRMLYQLSYRSKKPTPKTSFNNYLKFRLLLLFIMFRTILIKTTERIMYGFGFGIGMGTAFKYIPIDRNNKKVKQN